jgi:hypothetical protein
VTTEPGPAKKAPLLATAAGLLGLVVLSVLLRAWGLGWGLPSAARFYPYHPDESVLLHAICSVNPLWADFTPSFYNYGSFSILLTRWVYDIAAPLAGWGTVPRGEPFPQWVGDFAHLLLVGRWLTVLLGAGAVVATYALGRRLFGPRTGWLAAGFLAVVPIQVLLGHYLTVDVPSTCLSTLALAIGAAALNAADPKRSARCIVAAAFVAGLAVGTKYNTVPVVLSLLVPLWQLWQQSGASRRAAIGAAVGAVVALPVAFLLSTPGAILQQERFIRDVAYEMGRNAEGQGLVFEATPAALLYHLGISLPIGLEWPLYLLALAGLGLSLVRRRLQDVYLWLFILPFFLLLVPAQRKFVRYVTPLVPPLVILAGRLVDEGLATRRRKWYGAAAGVAAGAALASTIAHLGVISGPDARDLAAEYLNGRAQPTETVALASDAWTYTPPIDPTAGAVKYAQPYGGPPIWDLELAMGRSRPDITQLPRFRILAPRSVITAELRVPEGALSVVKLEQHRPEWVVISDYEYEDPERVRRANPAFQDGRLDLLAAMSGSYHIEREFRPRPSLAGFTWWRRGIPPHDWRYYMPTVRIYRRN